MYLQVNKESFYGPEIAEMIKKTKPFFFHHYKHFRPCLMIPERIVNCEIEVQFFKQKKLVV